MRQNVKRWITGLAVGLFVIGGAWSLYRLLQRTDQELEMRVFEVTISLDQFPMPFSDPQAVRCPPALAQGETGTIHLRTTNESSAAHTLTIDYGTCHVNIEPGETVETDCAIYTDNVTADYLIAHMLPVDNDSSIYSPRKALCSIPMVNVGSLDGQQALMVTFLPGLLAMLAGVALWIAAGQAAHRKLRILTITGALFVVVMLIAVISVTLLTAVNLRGYLLIALAVGAILLAAVLVVQLVAFGILYGRRPSEE